MASDQIIGKVRARMHSLRITQPELAAACRLTQPHLSKVLSKNVKLARKTEARLKSWLEFTDDKGKEDRRTVRELAARIERLRPDRRVQIMELLTAIERLLNDS